MQRPDDIKLWSLLANNREQAHNWIIANFIFFNKRTSWDYPQRYLVAPVFDPTDIIYLKIVTEQETLQNIRHVGWIDIRSELAIKQDEVKMLSLRKLAQYNMMDGGNSYPHPEPKGDDRDKLDLRRRWIAPDPFDDPRDHDERGFPDEPEWLASAIRLRRRSRQSLRFGSSPTGRDNGGRSLDDVLAVGGLQQGSQRGLKVPHPLSQQRALPGSTRMPSSMGQAQRAQQAPNGPKRSHRGGIGPVEPSGMFDRLDSKRKT